MVFAVNKACDAIAQCVGGTIAFGVIFLLIFIYHFLVEKYKAKKDVMEKSLLGRCVVRIVETARMLRKVMCSRKIGLIQAIVVTVGILGLICYLGMLAIK